jgi:hypothetical protein
MHGYFLFSCEIEQGIHLNSGLRLRHDPEGEVMLNKNQNACAFLILYFHGLQKQALDAWK